MIEACAWVTGEAPLGRRFSGGWVVSFELAASSLVCLGWLFLVRGGPIGRRSTRSQGAVHSGPDRSPLGIRLEDVYQTLAAAIFLEGDGRLVGAGELNEEARARHVAGNGFDDEGLRDAVGILADQGVDGAAQAHGGAAGRGLVLFGGCRRFAAAWLTWCFCGLRFRVVQVRGFFGHRFLPFAATAPVHVVRGIAACAAGLANGCLKHSGKREIILQVEAVDGM